MNEINPLAGSILQGTQVQQQQSAEKVRQVHLQQKLGKNVAAGDVFEHAVESAEELTPIHEEGSKQQPQRRGAKKKPSTDDDKPHVDLTA